MTAPGSISPSRRLPPITAANRTAERLEAAKALAVRMGRLAAPPVAEGRSVIHPRCLATVCPLGPAASPAPAASPPEARGGPSARMVVSAEALPIAGEGRRERMPDDVAEVVTARPHLPADFAAETARRGDDAGPSGAARRRVRVHEIKRAVAAEFDLTLVEIESDRRSRAVVRPRQLAMWLASKLTSASTPEIGRAFGGRDHTTVLHALKATEARIAVDAELAARASAVLMRLGVRIEP